MPRRAMESLTESMFYVLMALCRAPMCGTDIADEIERCTQGRLKIGPATLYTVLAKFEQERYIKEIKVEGRRRIYEITEKGRAAYHAELARLHRCITDAELASQRTADAQSAMGEREGAI